MDSPRGCAAGSWLQGAPRHSAALLLDWGSAVPRIVGGALESTWRDAIIRVLREAGVPLHYTDIASRALSEGYYQTDGATPANTVNAQVSTSISEEGSTSPFVRVSRGKYALREVVVSAGATANSPSSVDAPLTEAEIERSDSVINAFGMFWQRDRVLWRAEPRLFGKQQGATTQVDFGGQRGIYVLCDHHTVVYVGRSIDRGCPGFR